MGASHRTPTTASTTGYWVEIGCPHHRHLPCSSSQEITGMLSRQAIRRWQWGQLDGGGDSERAFLSFFARRRMHTLRKLPKQSPRTAAPARETAPPAPPPPPREKEPPPPPPR